MKIETEKLLNTVNVTGDDQPSDNIYANDICTAK